MHSQHLMKNLPLKGATPPPRGQKRRQTAEIKPAKPGGSGGALTVTGWMPTHTAALLCPPRLPRILPMTAYPSSELTHSPLPLYRCGQASACGSSPARRGGLHALCVQMRTRPCYNSCSSCAVWSPADGNKTLMQRAK